MAVREEMPSHTHTCTHAHTHTHTNTQRTGLQGRPSIKDMFSDVTRFSMVCRYSAALCFSASSSFFRRLFSSSSALQIAHRTIGQQSLNNHLTPPPTRLSIANPSGSTPTHARTHTRKHMHTQLPPPRHVHSRHMQARGMQQTWPPQQ